MSVRVQGGTRIEAIEQRVVINGRVRPEIQAEDFTQALGTQGASLPLSAPTWLWDRDRRELKGALVVVYARLRGGSWGAPVFRGWIRPMDAEAAPGSERITLEAGSFLTLADECRLGADNPAGGPEYSYPVYAWRVNALERTGWNLKTILRDWWNLGAAITWTKGGARLPVEWASEVSLGSLAALDRAVEEVSLGDITLRMPTLRSALEELLGKVGNVQVYETFTSSGTVLNFVRVADPAAPRKTVRVARRGVRVTRRNVESINRRDTVDGVKSRIIGYGARMQYVVTLSTSHLTLPLIQDWNPALAAAVLANPQKSFEGYESGEGEGMERGEWTPEHAKVFRRWVVPDPIWRLCREGLVDAENALELTTPAGEKAGRMPVQVFMWGRVLREPNEGELTANPDYVLQSDPAEAPKLITGARFDARTGVIELPRPAVNLAYTVKDAEKGFLDYYMAAHVGITITLNQGRIYSDTGVRGDLAFEGVGAPVDSFTNDSFRFVQIGAGVFDLAGVEHSLRPVLYYLEGAGWVAVEDDTIVRDMRGELRDFTRAALEERKDGAIAYAVSFPTMTRAYTLGDRIEVEGEATFEARPHQVYSIRHSLGRRHATSISTDSQRPLYFADLDGIDASPGPIDPVFPPTMLDELPGTLGQMVGSALRRYGERVAANRAATNPATRGLPAEWFEPTTGGGSPPPDVSGWPAATRSTIERPAPPARTAPPSTLPAQPREVQRFSTPDLVSDWPRKDA